GCPDLLDPAVVEDGEAVAHGQCFLLVVRDVDEGDPDLPDGTLDPLQLDLHLLAELQIEGSQWLIEQQHLRVVDEGPCEGDPLALAAGELDRLSVAEAGKLNDLQDLVHLQPSLSARDSAHT